MPTITSTGVGSGLDVNAIVTGLMSTERQALTRLQKEAAGDQAELSAFGNLQSQVANLADVAGRLASPSAWSPMQADSSDSASVSATVTSGATPGPHAIEVQQLAQSQVLASDWFASSASVVGTGTFTLDIGTTAGGVFTPKAGSTPVSIPIDAAHDTLAGVRDAINAANAGVSASIVNGPSGAKLVLRSASGADSSIRLQAADDDGANGDAAGLSALAWDPAAAAGSGANLTQTQAALDASFSIDGVALTSATNQPSTALDGVTLTLSKVTSAPVQLTVSVQTSALTKNVNDFVGAWNALNSLLRSQTKPDPGGQANGPLQGDFTAMSVLNGLRGMLQGSVGGVAAGLPASLAAAGVQLQQDGSLKVDGAKLSKLTAQPGQLAALFTQAQSGSDAGTRGFAVRFKAWADGLGGTGGVLAGRVEGLQHDATDNQKRQDREQDRLDRVEAQLRAQYQRLDTQMSTLNAQMARMKSSLGLS